MSDGASTHVLYLHGFASSPQSRKGMACERFLSERGFEVHRLDLRLPDRNRLRLSSMIEAALDQVTEGSVVIGSSLGGLVASHVASGDDRVQRLVLMAPAFRFAERWARSLGVARLAAWRGGEALVVDDHAGGPPLQIDYGFYEDAAGIDVGFPDLRMPVLVFHGVRDDVVPVDGSRAFVAQAADARLVELDDGHALTDSVDTILQQSHAFLTT